MGWVSSPKDKWKWPQVALMEVLCWITGYFSLPTGLSSTGTGCLGMGLGHHPQGFLKAVQMWHLKTRFSVGLVSVGLDLMISKIFTNLNYYNCLCACVSLLAFMQCPVLCPATRGFLYLPAGFGFLMILIILALNVMQSSMPLPLRSLPCDWRVSLPYCPWVRGMKRQRAPLPQGRRGPGWPRCCVMAAPAQPSHHQAILLSLEEGKCIGQVWKNHIFHPTPPASKLWGNGCTSRG